MKRVLLLFVVVNCSRSDSGLRSGGTGGVDHAREGVTVPLADSLPRPPDGAESESESEVWNWPDEGETEDTADALETDDPVKFLFDGKFCERVRAGLTSAGGMLDLRALNGMSEELGWLEDECIREDVAIEDITALMRNAKIYYVAVWNLGTYYDRELRFSRGVAYDAGCFPVVEEFDVQTEKGIMHVGKAIGFALDNQATHTPCKDDPGRTCSYGNPQIGWAYEYVPISRRNTDGITTVFSTRDKRKTNWYTQEGSYPACDEEVGPLRRLGRQ